MTPRCDGWYWWRGDLCSDWECALVSDADGDMYAMRVGDVDCRRVRDMGGEWRGPIEEPAPSAVTSPRDHECSSGLIGQPCGACCRRCRC